MSQRSGVVCRLITEDAIERVADCLTRGFPSRERSYWARALQRMSERPAVGDYPRYGYALFADDDVVGVLLTIMTRFEEGGAQAVRCNLSSWCIDDAYRGYAPLLHRASVRRKEVVYINISPADHTRPLIEALGFRRFSDGQILAAPLLSGARSKARVAPYAAGSAEAALLPEGERRILADHAALGCRALVCIEDGAAYPFIFQDRRIVRQLIPCPQLVYCRDIAEFVRFARPLGRYLLARTGPFCLVDANGPIAGLVGRYFANRAPKYFEGPTAPGLGDLAYTELVLFGP